MTNRLELSWDVDGFFEEQRYYCSSIPINANHLPTPKAVLANDLRTYVDTDIIEGPAYYVRIGSVKNGVEKLSDEIYVIAFNGYANKFFNLNGLISFNSDVVISADQTNGGLTWGSATLMTSAIIKLSNSPSFKNFTAQFEYTRLSGTSSSSNFSLLFRTTYWSDNDSGKSAYAIYLNPNRIGMSRGSNSSNSTETVVGSTPYTFNLNQKYLIKIIAANNNFEIYVDNLLAAQFSDEVFSNTGQFGFRTWTNGDMIAKIENLYISE